MLPIDALPHLPSPANETIKLDMRIEYHGFTTERLKQLQDATAEDPILAIVFNLTQEGWPNNRKRVPHIARQYWDQRDELSTNNGLLMKGQRTIIPTCQ